MIESQKIRQIFSSKSNSEKAEFPKTTNLDHSKSNEGLKNLIMLLGSQSKKNIKTEIESLEPLSANRMRSQNLFGNIGCSNSKKQIRPPSSSFTNVLMPSILGNPKLQENI